ncbi:O-acyltransferase like protein-like [Trichoplusia ni]|uniref:O-acyltransferase like protein-like n=1 Tax=Trichoplusia ni TaxID=7111 RepID=A0A7E5WJ71_TRINI|nr:O-acyltransferase like protein-like [Trichoplusia ni]
MGSDLMKVLKHKLPKWFTLSFSDKDLASFPKLFYLDDYKRCLAKDNGLYCLGSFDLAPASNPHPTYDLMKAFSDESYRHFNRTRIHRGYCVSERCPTSNNHASSHLRINISSQTTSQRFEQCVNRYAQRSSLRASLRELHYCRSHSDATTEQSPTTADLTFTRVVYAIIILNIISTIYDVYTEDGPNKSKLLTTFSIPENYRRLTVFRESSDPRLSILTPMQGIRIMSLGFTTYAHASVLHFSFYINNPEYLEELTQRVDGIYLSSGTSLTQSFVMISCFLTGYNLLLFSEKQDLNMSLLPMCIIKRVIRISPVHMLVVGYAATWWMQSRDGPFVPTTIGLDSEACRARFWSHFFYINNIVDPKDYCLCPTWFLPVDMHMYILACALTLLLWRRRSLAVKIYLVLLVASCLLIAVVVYINDYKTLTLFATPEQIRRVFRDNRSFTEFYMSSWSALPSCFMGLILAHIQYEIIKGKIKLSQYRWFVILHYISFPLLFVFSLTGYYARSQTSLGFSIAYTTLDRPAFCLLMAITLLGFFNVDSPMKRFYSWPIWSIMAKMSLTVMLLHWCVGITIGTRSLAYNTSLTDTTVDWVATNLITIFVAVPVTVMLEIPAQRFFEKLLFT